MSLKYGTVRLEKYNPDWQDMFLEEKENLKQLFGDIALSIEHIGSTSVEGLSAKPIIDIAVGVDNLSDFLKIKSLFENEPYSVKDDPALGEELIRKGFPNTAFLIHVMEINGKRYQDTIIFRDYLRKNPNTMQEYEHLKEELAIMYANNRPMYTSSKNEFIQSILAKAYKEKS